MIKADDFQLLFENAPGLYLVLKPDFTIIAVSDAYLKATMTKRQQICGKDLFEIFPDNPNDPSATGESNLKYSLKAVIRTKKVHTMAIQKYDIRNEKGVFEERFWSPLNKPVLNKKGKLLYIIHRVEDVTDFVRIKKQQADRDKETEELRGRIEVEIYQRAQEIEKSNKKLKDEIKQRQAVERKLAKLNHELEEKVEERTAEVISNELRFRSLIEHNYDSTVITDQKGQTQYTSPAATRMLGWTTEERLNMTLFDLIHEEDVARSKQLFQEVLKTPDQSFFCTHRLKHKKGHYIWVEGVLTNLLNEPYINGVIGNFHDISERKEAEKKIAEMNQELEKKVIDRTSKLADLNKELESFSYSVSHDLRAPLRSINGYTRILIEDYGEKIDEEGKRLMNVVMNNAKRMGQLIDDLLSFSRVGKQNLVRVQLDMTSLTNGVLYDCRQQYQDRDINVKISPLEKIPGDHSMLKQVMLNLISNSIKYSSKKENVNIEIGSYQKENEVVFFVKDSGAGFDMNYYDKLFGVFQRLHSFDEFEGTGVGLAIVQRIISKHNGKVWADGKVGEGAVFYFSLPIN